MPSVAPLAAGNEAMQWDGKVQEAREAVTFQANAMATAYGKVLNVSTDDILWGTGQVSLLLPALESHI